MPFSVPVSASRCLLRSASDVFKAQSLGVAVGRGIGRGRWWSASAWLYVKMDRYRIFRLMLIGCLLLYHILPPHLHFTKVLMWHLKWNSFNFLFVIHHFNKAKVSLLSFSFSDQQCIKISTIVGIAKLQHSGSQVAFVNNLGLVERLILILGVANRHATSSKERWRTAMVHWRSCLFCSCAQRSP